MRVAQATSRHQIPSNPHRRGHGSFRRESLLVAAMAVARPGLRSSTRNRSASKAIDFGRSAWTDRSTSTCSQLGANPREGRARDRVPRPVRFEPTGVTVWHMYLGSEQAKRPKPRRHSTPIRKQDHPSPNPDGRSEQTSRELRPSQVPSNTRLRASSRFGGTRQ